MICICTNIPEELKDDGFEVGKFYRMVKAENGNRFVFGVQLGESLYDKGFKDATTDEVYDKAVEIYEEKGQSGVFDFADEVGIDHYKYCEPCEIESPTNGDDCLVCGSSF